MTYATVTEVKSRINTDLLEQLAGNDPEAIDDNAIGVAIQDASDEIDGYLDRVPAAERPSATVLRPHCIDITMYRLLGNIPGAELETVTERRKGAVRFLERLAEGRFPGAGSQDSPTGGEVLFDGPERVFTHEAMKDY